MSRERRWPLTLAGAGVLAAVLFWTGTGPVVAGLGSLDGPTLALGAVLAVPTTVANAWRWQLVAGRLGVHLDLRTAVASCYRSQFLNVTLPGGVVGDVHRGLRHGRASDAAEPTTGPPTLGLRAVAWERSAGQVVQAVLAFAGLALLPSPVRGHLPEVAGAVAVVLGAAVVASQALRRTARPVAPTRRTWATRLLRTVRTDFARVTTSGTLPRVVLASTVAVAGYVATYVVAARAVGVSAPLERLLPLVLLVLLAAALPVNVAGWGPREGMAAWSFAAAGLGAGQGLATAVAYGGLVLAGTLPGAVVLALSTRRAPRAPTPAPPRCAVGTGGARG